MYSDFESAMGIYLSQFHLCSPLFSYTHVMRVFYIYDSLCLWYHTIYTIQQAWYQCRKKEEL